jgi:hypothetical protein
MCLEQVLVCVERVMRSRRNTEYDLIKQNFQLSLSLLQIKEDGNALNRTPPIAVSYSTLIVYCLDVVRQLRKLRKWTCAH